MKLYKCRGDGFFSLSDEVSCPVCDSLNWEPAGVDTPDREAWETMFECTESPQEELQVAKAWAESGDTEGIMLLAGMYMSGSDAWDRDTEKSIELLQQLADRRHPDGTALLGSCYIFGTGVEVNYEKGVELLWKAQDLKSGDAAYLLGMLHENGVVVNRDIKNPEKLFEQTAKYGPDMGMFARSENLLEKAKSTKGVEKALFGVWKAASEDLGEAQLALGVALSKPGFPVSDMNQAIYWLNRATENNCDGAASALALACLNLFDESPVGPDDILLKLQQALDRGDASAAKTLGDFYKDGILVAPDPVRAYKYYRMGQGRDKECSAAVAHCHHYGIGVEKNAGFAHCILSDLVALDRQYIEDGTPMEAIVELGDMYRDGDGVTADSRKAANLYVIAGYNGNPCALGRIGREILMGNKFITVNKDGDPNALLKEASVRGDADSAFFLAKRFLSAGDREQAANYTRDALFWKDAYTGDDIVQFAMDNFPSLLEESSEKGAVKKQPKMQEGHPEEGGLPAL